MLRKIAIALIALAVVWLGGRALVRALVSDETKIRWRLEEACEGFNATRMGPILDFLASDFVEESTGGHRDDVRAAVAGLFFSEKDPQTKKFPLRVEIVPDTLTIVVDRDGNDKAILKCSIRLVDTRGGEGTVRWEFALDGVVVEGDDGWQLQNARCDDLKGSKYGRGR